MLDYVDYDAQEGKILLYSGKGLPMLMLETYAGNVLYATKRNKDDDKYRIENNADDNFNRNSLNNICAGAKDGINYNINDDNNTHNTRSKDDATTKRKNNDKGNVNNKGTITSHIINNAKHNNDNAPPNSNDDNNSENKNDSNKDDNNISASNTNPDSNADNAPPKNKDNATIEFKACFISHPNRKVFLFHSIIQKLSRLLTELVEWHGDRATEIVQSRLM